MRIKKSRGRNMQEIFTIGHSVYSINKFIELLNIFNINCVIDVRSVPFSKYAPQYNNYELKICLNEHGISYLYMGKEFGARQTDKALFTPEGYVDFAKVKKQFSFLKGMERIRNGLKKGYTLALMCTEKDPINCHRNILVAKAFYDEGFTIKNIHGNGDIETQEKLEQRLLNHYFPTRKQKTLLDIIDGEKTEQELTNECYRLRNKEIAYREATDGEVHVI
jgi:uncharacterized protein (DUF488 family)